MKSTDDLSQQARFLRNAAPREFENFCKAFEDYAVGVLQNLAAEIPATDLQRYQGHAQQCKKLMDMFDIVRRS